MMRRNIMLLSLLAMARASSTDEESDAIDYCAKTEYCAEGTHVMCMYEKDKQGPTCSNYLTTFFYARRRELVLDVLNMIRSRIARGNETGENDQLLPRGYGIFRLEWDSELASFAQLVTNQCVLGLTDLCRATEQFPDPSQVSGTCRFHENWDLVSDAGIQFDSNFNSEKVDYALSKILYNWFEQKTSVTPSDTTFFPDYELAENAKGRIFLRMAYGSATHIGCGISAFSQSDYQHDANSSQSNFILVVCNLSASPRVGTSVYNTVPPVVTWKSNPCGCPVGSSCDEMYLCVEDPPPSEEEETEPPPCADLDCNPAVAILPIFTFEDAPPEKLMHNKYLNATEQRRMDNYLNRHHANRLIEDQHFINSKLRKAVLKPPQIVKKPPVNTTFNEKHTQVSSLANQHMLSITNVTPRIVFYENTLNSTSKTASVDKNNMQLNELTKLPKLMQRVTIKKQSISSQPETMQLPLDLYPPIKTEQNVNGVNDIVPKNYHTNTKKLLDRYLNEKHPITKVSKAKNNQIPKQDTYKSNVLMEGRLNESDEDNHTAIDDEHMKNVLSILRATKPKAVKNVLARYSTTAPFIENMLNITQKETKDRLNKNIVTKHNEYNGVTNKGAKDPDKRLMALLNTLEKEMQHIELRDTDIKLFDEKIRTIYGKFVGKPVDLNREVKKPVDIRHIYGVEDINLNKKSIKQDSEDHLRELMLKQKMEDHKSKFKYGMKDMYTYSSSSVVNQHKKTIQNEHDKYSEINLTNDLYSIRSSKLRYNDRYDARHVDERNDRRGYDRYVERDRYKDDNLGIRNEHRDVLGYNGGRTRNFYSRNNKLMNNERRQFYQDKLNNIEKGLEMGRRISKIPPARRPVKSDNQMDLYGRARFAHGY